MQYIKELVLLMILLLSVACSKDDDASKDLEKPTAEISLVNTIAIDSSMEIDTELTQMYLMGTSIVINATFFDNAALQKCEITISPIRALKGVDTDWDYAEDQISLSGTSYTIEKREILGTIPVNIYEGDYRIFFKVLDEENNYTSYSEDVYLKF